MKTFKLLSFLIVLGLAFVSCSDDGDDLPSVRGNKYKAAYAKVEITNNATGESVSKEYSTPEELAEQGLDNEIEFKEDGTFYDDGVKTGTWTEADSVVDVTLDDGTTSGATVTANKVVVIFSIEASGFTSKFFIDYSKM